MLKDLLSDKEKLLGLANTSLTENCTAVLLKRLPKKLGDPKRDILPIHGYSWIESSALTAAHTSRCLWWEERSSSERRVMKNLIFHADRHTSQNIIKSMKISHLHDSIIIDITCEDLFPKVLNIKKSNHPFSGSTTSPSDSFPSLTPFETSDSLLEESVDELTLLGLFLPGNKEDNFDPEADLREIEYFLNRDPSTDSSPKTDIDIIRSRFS
ncbi:hypothetical protein Tco_0700777 [Tanacetum coccineum]